MWNLGIQEKTTGADKIRAGVTWVTGECQSPRQIWRRRITAMRDAGWYLPSGSTGWRSSGLKAAVGTKGDIDPTSWPEEPGVGEDYREVMSPGNISDVSRKVERGREHLGSKDAEEFLAKLLGPIGHGRNMVKSPLCPLPS